MLELKDRLLMIFLEDMADLSMVMDVENLDSQVGLKGSVVEDVATAMPESVEERQESAKRFLDIYSKRMPMMQNNVRAVVGAADHMRAAKDYASEQHTNRRNLPGVRPEDDKDKRKVFVEHYKQLEVTLGDLGTRTATLATYLHKHAGELAKFLGMDAGEIDLLAGDLLAVFPGRKREVGDEGSAV